METIYTASAADKPQWHGCQRWTSQLRSPVEPAIRSSSPRWFMAVQNSHSLQRKNWIGSYINAFTISTVQSQRTTSRTWDISKFEATTLPRRCELVTSRFHLATFIHQIWGHPAQTPCPSCKEPEKISPLAVGRSTWATTSDKADMEFKWPFRPALRGDIKGYY
jgi:hypothetical protein